MTKAVSAPRRKLALLALAGVLTLSGCVSPIAGRDGLYAEPIGNAPVTANPTPYSAALVCLGSFARANGMAAPRIAVGRILDYTGKSDLEGGRRITQGASLMAISAFAKAGARLVERFDTSVSELELKYANNKLISGDQEGQEFRQILAGQVPGSDFYLVGGITELNTNIRSVGADVFVGAVDARDPKGSFSPKLYVMNVGLDLRLIDTRTLEVVDVVSYQKQIVGREIGVGYFQFFDDVVLDLGAGGRAQEPVQLAVRSVIERAVVEMASNLYGVGGPEACRGAMGRDPLGDVLGETGGFTPRFDSVAVNNAETRAEPGRWHDEKDRDLRWALRGRN